MLFRNYDLQYRNALQRIIRHYKWLKFRSSLSLSLFLPFSFSLSFSFFSSFSSLSTSSKGLLAREMLDPLRRLRRIPWANLPVSGQGMTFQGNRACPAWPSCRWKYSNFLKAWKILCFITGIVIRYDSNGSGLW